MDLNDPDVTPTPTPGTLDRTCVADLIVEGLTLEQVAERTGVPLAVVTPIYHSPLTRNLVDVKRRTSRYRDASGRFDVEKALTVETEATFSRLVEIRDTADKPETQLSAAKELFDRQRPKITRTEDERTVRIVLSKDEQALAGATLTELAAMDAEFAVLDETTPLKETPNGPDTL